MSREAPLGLEGVALKEAQGDLGVADVEREEHGSNLSREGPLGHLDVGGPPPPQPPPRRAPPPAPGGPSRVRPRGAPSGATPAARPARGAGSGRPRSQSRRA